MRRMQVLVLMIASAWIAGCGDSAPSSVEAETTTTAEVTTTTTRAVSDDQLAAAAAIGDIAAGEELFNSPVEGIPHRMACASCHVLEGEDTPNAPSLAAISERAADRVAGMSAVDYLRQSIVDPFAFVVPGDWVFPMPHRYVEVLSEDDIDNLVAFLLTR